MKKKKTIKKKKKARRCLALSPLPALDMENQLEAKKKKKNTHKKQDGQRLIRRNAKSQLIPFLKCVFFFPSHFILRAFFFLQRQTWDR